MAVLDRAYAYWKADQSRVLDRLLKDLSGRRHHLYVGGSTSPPPMVVDGALESGGASINAAQAPDVAAFRFTGDLDVRVEMQHYAAQDMNLVTHEVTGSTGRRWKLYRQGSRLDFNFSPDGTSAAEVQVVGPAPDFTTRKWFRVTFELNVAGVWRVIFYQSTTYDPATETGVWTNLQTVTGTVPGALTSQNAPIQLGYATTEGNSFRGAIYRMQLRSGVNGTIVASPDFTTAVDGTARILDQQGNRWTLGSQPGWITDDGFQGTSSCGMTYWDPFLNAYAGDVDLRVALKGFATGTITDTNILSGRDDGSGRAGWRISATIGTLGRLNIRFQHTFANGTTTIDTNSGAVPGTDAMGWEQIWRVVFTPNNGLGGYTIKFYNKTTTAATAYADMLDHTGWTLLNTVTNTTAGAATNFSMYYVPYGVGWGGNPSAGSGFPGIYYAGGVWLNSTSSGNPYMAVDLHAAPVGARRINDAWGKEWVLRQAGGTTNDPVLLTKESGESTYLYLPGVAGNTVTTPNSAAFNPVDLDVRIKAAPDIWAATTAFASLEGAAGNIAWRMAQNGSGRGITFSMSTNGTTIFTSNPNVGLFPKVEGGFLWLRVTRIGSTGVVTIYWSLDYNPADGTGTWTQAWQETLTAGALFASTSPLAIGGRGAGSTSDPFLGRVMYFELRNGVNGPVVASFDPSGLTVASTTYADAQGNTWTINRSTSGRKSVVVERTKWMGGTDDFFEALDHADFNAAATDSITVSILQTRFNTGTGTTAALVSKQPGVTGSAGWTLLKWSTAGVVRLSVYDGTTQATDIGNDADGQFLVSGVRNGSGSKTVEAFQDAASTGGATADSTSATLFNTNTVRVFRMAGASTNYADGEFLGAAFFREALIAADLTSLKTELLSTGAGLANYPVALSAPSNSAASISKAVVVAKSYASVGLPSVAKSVAVSRAAVSQTNPSIRKGVALSRSVGSLSIALIDKSASVIKAASSVGASSVGKSVSVIKAVSSAGASSVGKGVDVLKLTASAAGVSVAKAVAVHKTVASQSLTSISKSVTRSLTAISGSVASVIKIVSKGLDVTDQSLTSILAVSARQVIMSVFSASSASLSKAVLKLFSVGSLGRASSIKSIGKALEAITAGAVSSFKAVGKGLSVATQGFAGILRLRHGTAPRMVSPLRTKLIESGATNTGIAQGDRHATKMVDGGDTSTKEV